MNLIQHDEVILIAALTVLEHEIKHNSLLYLELNKWLLDRSKRPMTYASVHDLLIRLGDELGWEEE